MTGALFEYLVGPPAPKLSATQRLTQSNNDCIAQRIHPATRVRLRAGTETCGDCAHHNDYHYHSKRFHKCELHRLGETHSAHSDIRVSWPACTLFEAKP